MSARTLTVSPSPQQLARPARSVAVLRLPPADLFQDAANQLAEVIRNVGAAVDEAVAAKLTAAQRLADVDAALATTKESGLITPERGPIAVRTLRADVRYMLHRRPHKADSPDVRAEKLRTSAAARRSEGPVTVVSRARVSEWTTDEMVRVIDRVREKLPKSDPSTVEPLRAIWADRYYVVSGDRFKGDGRALTSLSLDGHHGKYALRVSTAAGFSVVIWLTEPPPAATLVALIPNQPDEVVELRLELSKRAMAGVARATARMAELEARKATLRAAADEPRRTQAAGAASAPASGRRSGGAR